MNLQYVVLVILVIVSSSSFGLVYGHKADIVGDYKIEIGWEKEPPIQGIENSIELVITYATDEDRKEIEKMHKMMNMGNMTQMGKGMKMSDQAKYEDDISIILGKFEADKITATEAIGQIRDLVNQMKTESQVRVEIDDLLERVKAGGIQQEDALYEMIGMFGAATVEETDRVGGVADLESSIKLSVTLNKQEAIIPLTESNVEGIYYADFIPPTSGFLVVHIAGNIEGTKVDLDMHPEEIEPLSFLSPLKQIRENIEPSDVQCKEGLELYKRTHKDSVVCVSDKMAQILLERGIIDFF